MEEMTPDNSVKTSSISNTINFFNLKLYLKLQLNVLFVNFLVFEVEFKVFSIAFKSIHLSRPRYTANIKYFSFAHLIHKYLFFSSMIEIELNKISSSQNTHTHGYGSHESKRPSKPEQIINSILL